MSLERVKVSLNDKEALQAFRSIEDAKLIDKVVQLREIFREPGLDGGVKYTFIGMFNIRDSPEVSSCTIELLDNPNENPRYTPLSMQAVL